jgi:hypothetical protein
MSDVRREESFVYVNKDGREQKYNLLDIAEYWVNHNNDEFWQRYGMNWPFEIGEAQDILDEYKQNLAKKRGLPSISETRSVIDLIDEQIEKTKLILQKDTHTELGKSQVLKINDLALLDDALEEIMDRIEMHHPSIVGDWESPHSQSSSETQKQHQIDKQLFEKDPFFQIRKYRFALLSSKSILQEYIKTMSSEQNNEVSENQQELWFNNFNSRIAVLSLIATVIALAFALLGDTK